MVTKKSTVIAGFIMIYW